MSKTEQKKTAPPNFFPLQKKSRRGIICARNSVFSSGAQVSTLLMSFFERDGMNLHLATMARLMNVVPIIYNQGYEN